MAEYVLDNDIKNEVSNLVHLDHCAELKNATNTLYIGSFGSPVAAYNIALGYKFSVDYCPTCLSKMTA